jgi:hypothetical protein
VRVVLERPASHLPRKPMEVVVQKEDFCFDVQLLLSWNLEARANSELKKQKQTKQKNKKKKEKRKKKKEKRKKKRKKKEKRKELKKEI